MNSINAVAERGFFQTVFNNCDSGVSSKMEESLKFFSFVQNVMST